MSVSNVASITACRYIWHLGDRSSHDGMEPVAIKVRFDYNPAKAAAEIGFEDK
jgi:hypothetical protein